MNTNDISWKVEELMGDLLNHKDREVIEEVLSGKRKLIFGDETVANLFKNLNEHARILNDIGGNKNEIYNYIESEIRDKEGEIEGHEDEISCCEAQIRYLKNLKRDIASL